jgi:hypothetical protein
MNRWVKAVSIHILTGSWIIGGGFRDFSLIQFSLSIIFAGADGGDLAFDMSVQMDDGKIHQFL